ncbi:MULTISPECIES: DUF2244 domain-containing protein [unclassified Chelatococcus]|uniref:DUF2244 domain-containing protein n=1 Tax=unclassified Chelatococcus TaxID=2638111 RepID=UPI00058FFEB0|nr:MULTISPECIES: DUF2244 domain-containing protein [unclassified Chelatococcus]ALA17132.1 hypothetical protein AL346_06610 [Chelatococcus sp. CO-6]
MTSFKHSLPLGPEAVSDPAAEPLFCALITPHRSLGHNAFRLVMTLMCVATFVSSVPFMLAGAWPVAAFFGLDLLAIYLAFRVNFRRARSFEEVFLTRIELLLRKVGHRGDRREWRFNPAWTRLERVSDEDFGLQRLTVVSRGESVPVANALSASEKADFADAFSAALRTAKRG